MTVETSEPNAAPVRRAALPAALLELVVKERVHLGNLAHARRLEALALVWCALPRAPRDERGINEALRDALAGAAAFLATDHVELRRWLVDTGLLARDGFGRVYERTAFGALPPAAQAAVATLQDVDHAELGAACSAARAQLAERRAARRATWQGRDAASAGPAAAR